MDAYSSYIRIISEARVGELRREAAEYALSRAARHRRRSLWSRLCDRLAGTRRRPPGVPVQPVPLPVEAEARVDVVGDAGLRRSA